MVQRRNPLLPGERDNHVYQLLVDVDDDSTTGDTTRDVPAGFRGADLALEWTNLTTADDGTGAQVRMLHWSDTLQTWIAGAYTGEGMDVLSGLAFHQNEVDDPSTIAVRQGDQRMPSGTVSYASGGVTEIGLRSGAGNSLHRIRWAIIPVGMSADTVRAATGGMLTFVPQQFKPVVVDGNVSDWWPDNTPEGVEVHSRTDSTGGTLQVSIGLTNPGTKPVNGIQLKYWLHSDSTPLATLSGVPLEWSNFVVRSVVQDTSKAPGTWAITLMCGNCQLPGGTHLHSLAVLQITGPGVSSNPEDDWSNSSDDGSPNPRFPAYDLTGNVLFGSEPPPKSLRLPIARINPSGTLWATTGEAVVLRADSSFDPEHRTLAFEWWHSGTGIERTTIADTFVATSPGIHRISLRVYDPTNPLREAWATDSIYVQDSLGEMGTRPVLDTSKILFADSWIPQWNQMWTRNEQDVSVDTLTTSQGTQVVIYPSQGSTMVSLKLNSDFDWWIRASCDSSYEMQDPHYKDWCYDEEDLRKFSNLEFDVAMDGIPQIPVRILLTRLQYAGGATLTREERAGLIQGYMPDQTHPWTWQHVSIPLSDIYEEPAVRTAGFLQLKVIRDGLYSSGKTVLLDNIRLVKYRTGLGQVVTTRRTDLEVLANTSQAGMASQLGMAVRVENSSSDRLHLDSLRIRWFYHSLEGVTRPGTSGQTDTVFAADVPHFAYYNNGGLPLDSLIDTSTYQHYAQFLAWIQSPVPTANRELDLVWNPLSRTTPDKLMLVPSASAGFWIGIEAKPWVGIDWFDNIPFPGFNAGRSIQWSWPDYAQLWQVAPHVVIDGQKPDGTWGRMWGLGPNEDLATVTYWTRGQLIDPSRPVPG